MPASDTAEIPKDDLEGLEILEKEEKNKKNRKKMPKSPKKTLESEDNGNHAVVFFFLLTVFSHSSSTLSVPSWL